MTSELARLLNLAMRQRAIATWADQHSPLVADQHALYERAQAAQRQSITHPQPPAQAMHETSKATIRI